jgi:DUF1009 family protein
MIAGDGALPGAVAREAARRGQQLAVVAFPRITRDEIDGLATRVAWLGPGQVDAAIRFLCDAGARRAVMAGKVSKESLVAGDLELDARARRLLTRLSDWNDATLLGALGDELEREGIELLPQALLVPDWVAPMGPLGRVHPTPAQWQDVAMAWPVARAIAALDIGQSVVVHERAIVAVEAIEGTDEAIRRGGRLAGAGACIVKVARPAQDPRFDLPAIGPETLAVAEEVGAAVIAIEASRSLVLEREKVVERADEAGIALVGVAAEGLVPPPGAESDS